MATRTRASIAPILALAMLACASSAAADITAFRGYNQTPERRDLRGFSIGTGLLVGGFEFEYARTTEEFESGSPALKTFMFNGLAQTPISIARMQFYATGGGGVYRETLDQDSNTNIGVNVGGGVKVTLVGPIRLRLDYRIMTLRGEPRYRRPQRIYAGVNLKF